MCINLIPSCLVVRLPRLLLSSCGHSNYALHLHLSLYTHPPSSSPRSTVFISLALSANTPYCQCMHCVLVSLLVSTSRRHSHLPLAPLIQFSHLNQSKESKQYRRLHWPNMSQQIVTTGTSTTPTRSRYVYRDPTVASYNLLLTCLQGTPGNVSRF